MKLGILFDIDGTLMDTLDAIVASMKAALEAFRVKPLTKEELRPLIGMPVQRQMDLLRGMQGAVVDEITDQYYVHFMEHVERGLPLYPEVGDTLPRLADHPMSTMTTRRLHGARRMLEVSGIATFFQAIVGGDEVSRPKPYPDLPLFSAKALGVPPEHCIVVGDAPVDILAGRAARMWAVAAAYGYGSPSALREAKPHATIQHFSELPDVVADLELRVRAP
jgi:HAD superfamily hydrolase (TIGR01509 family)